jgi:hypothetical protein
MLLLLRMPRISSRRGPSPRQRPPQIEITPHAAKLRSPVNAACITFDGRMRDRLDGMQQVWHVEMFLHFREESGRKRTNLGVLDRLLSELKDPVRMARWHP